VHTEFAYPASLSIEFGLLALLERGPGHGHQVRADVDGGTGAAWPLDVGQVYTTLDRLEGDGLETRCIRGGPRCSSSALFPMPALVAARAGVSVDIHLDDRQALAVHSAR